MARAKSDILIAFGANVNKKRKDRKISQRNLSKLTGIDNADICRIEQGKVNLTLRSVQNLADGLLINAWELLVFK